MNWKAVICILLIAMLAVCVLATVSTPAYAQEDIGVSADKNLAEKKGIEGLFAGKGIKADDPRLAKPWQKWLGIGSIFVMIIVVKYL